MNVERIDVEGDPPVRGILHLAAASGADGLVLTHGAGGSADTPLLVAVAEAFVARGVTVLRCDLPFRQARPIAAEPALATALLLQSYPLHPPGRPRILRAAHFPDLSVPTLFVHGTTDPFGSLAELNKARALMPGRTALLKVNGAHDLGWSQKRGDVALPGRIAEAFLQLTG